MDLLNAWGRADSVLGGTAAVVLRNPRNRQHLGESHQSQSKAEYFTHMVG